MGRVIAWGVLIAVVLGIAGLAVTTERTSAQSITGQRFDLNCNQVIAPNDPDNPVPDAGVGLVRCSLRIDLPPALEPPDTIKLTIGAVYRDRDDNNRPSRGDRLLCIRVVGPGGTELLKYCRPGLVIPPGLSWPNS